MYVRILQNFLEHKSMLLIIHMKEVLKEIHIFLTKSRKKKIWSEQKETISVVDSSYEGRVGGT
jgi:hypothetical protein